MHSAFPHGQDLSHWASDGLAFKITTLSIYLSCRCFFFLHFHPFFSTASRKGSWRHLFDLLTSTNILSPSCPQSCVFFFEWEPLENQWLSDRPLPVLPNVDAAACVSPSSICGRSSCCCLHSTSVFHWWKIDEVLKDGYMPPVALLLYRSPLCPQPVGINFLACASFSWVARVPNCRRHGEKMYGFTKTKRDGFLCHFLHQIAP